MDNLLIQLNENLQKLNISLNNIVTDTISASSTNNLDNL